MEYVGVAILPLGQTNYRFPSRHPETGEKPLLDERNRRHLIWEDMDLEALKKHQEQGSVYIKPYSGYEDLFEEEETVVESEEDLAKNLLSYDEAKEYLEEEGIETPLHFLYSDIDAEYPTKEGDFLRSDLNRIIEMN